MQVCAGLAVVGNGFTAFQCQIAERVGGIAAEFGQAAAKVFAVPEVLGFIGVLLVLHQTQGLDDDDYPRCHGHEQQQDGHATGDKVALRPDVGNAELGFHENS